MIDILTHAAVGAACLALGIFLARVWHREWLSSLRSEAMSGRVEQAKQRGSDRAAEQIRTQVLGWDQPTEEGVRPGRPDLPPREWVVPVPDRVAHREPATEVLEPVRTAEQILADFPPPPPIPSWREREQEAAQRGDAPNPLYAETLESLPIIQPEADLLTAAVRVKPARLDWADVHDVEETPADDAEVPRDEGRVTEPKRDDDDPPAGPPPGQPGDISARALAGEALAPTMTSGAVPRYAWPRHAGPRGPWRPSDKLRTWAVLLQRRAVTRLTLPPQVRIRRLAGMWAGGELTMLMTGIPSSAHAVVRHRRRGGTWAVAA